MAGVAWSVPAVTVAAAAPAFASSMCSGCFRMSWSQFAIGMDALGQVGSSTLLSGTCVSNPTVSISGNREGYPDTADSGCSTDLYSSAFNLKVDYRGEQLGYSAAGGPYQFPCLSSTSPGLIFNIGFYTTSTVTFTFSQPVTSLEFDICDISRSNGSSSTYRYIDSFSFSEDMVVTGDMTYLVQDSVAGAVGAASVASGAVVPADNFIYRSSAYTTSGVPKVNHVKTTNATSISSFTITYTAPEGCGWQFASVGDLQFCI